MWQRFGSWRGWVVAGGAGAVLAVGLVGWAASRTARSGPPEGAAWLMVEPLPVLPGGVQEDRRSQLASLRRTQALLIVCPNVLEAASHNPLVQKLLAGQADPVAWLQARVKVDELSDDLLTVSMPGESRANQAIYVNAVVDAYLAAAADWELGRSQSQTRRNAAYLEDARAKLLAKRQALHETPPPEPAQAAAIADDIKVLEELTHRLNLHLETAMMNSQVEPHVQRIVQAY